MGWGVLTILTVLSYNTQQQMMMNVVHHGDTGVEVPDVPFMALPVVFILYTL